MDSMSYQDQQTLTEIGMRQSDELILTAANLLRNYQGRNLPRAAREAIALFAGQVALHDDRIIARATFKVLSLAEYSPAVLHFGYYATWAQHVSLQTQGSHVQVILETRDHLVGGVLAGAGVGFPRNSLYPCLFSPRCHTCRRTLENINITEDTHVGDQYVSMPQLFTHERTHCFLYTEDLEYGWGRCLAPADWDGSGLDLLENADSTSAIIFFLWCLVHKPEWDFSTDIPRRQRCIPRWLALFRTGFIEEEHEGAQPTAIEPRVIHLKNRDVVWRLESLKKQCSNGAENC